MEYTNNLKLSKPSYDDDVDIQVLNNNMDIIDNKFDSLITDLDDDGKQLWAPTLHLVKVLLSQLQIKNADDVIDAIDAKTFASLGVTYNLTNKAGWYICLGKLFGNLIIQGGICGESASNTDYKTFTLPFNNECYAMTAMTIIDQYKFHSWARPVNKTQFLAGIDNDYYGNFPEDALSYIAIGV